MRAREGGGKEGGRERQRGDVWREGRRSRGKDRAREGGMEGGKEGHMEVGREGMME